MHFQPTAVKKIYSMLNMKPVAIILLLIFVLSVSSYSQIKLSKDFEKKIKEATPKPLPQSPISEKLKSDAEDENLKGKVKSVVEERTGLSGVEKPVGRRHMSITDFDEKGNTLKRITFEYRGRPTDVTVYGYVDGARVSVSKSISFGDEFLIAVGTESKNEKKTKPDPRYEYKYEYKYVDGKLAEMQMVENTGSKGMRYAYKHSGNQVEEFVYTASGELNQHYLSKFDDKGSEIERTSFLPRAYGVRKNSFKYESFDEKGNWTRRTHSKVEIENGKEVHKPIAVEYRTITYYP